MKRRMYHVGEDKERMPTHNVFSGCGFGCYYCWVPRWFRKFPPKCKPCLLRIPHSHPEKLSRRPPKPPKGGFVFLDSTGDFAFASHSYLMEVLSYCRRYPDIDFLVQSKYPRRFEGIEIPDNVIVATTVETDRWELLAPYTRAPSPYTRLDVLSRIRARRMVSIEPVMPFTKLFPRKIEKVEPELVYIGLDNYKTGIPQPSWDEVLWLNDELKKFTEVRLKDRAEFGG